MWGRAQVLPGHLAGAEISADELVERHGDFVFRTLGRFGVPEADRADMGQEVFMVALRRGADARKDKLEPWLFGIARRVASGYRRRAHRRHEQASDQLACEPDQAPSPEEAAARAEAVLRLERILDAMSLDQRAVFVMYEVEGRTGAEIAADMGVPVQTVFSRLRRARAVFEKERLR